MVVSKQGSCLNVEVSGKKGAGWKGLSEARTATQPGQGMASGARGAASVSFGGGGAAGSPGCWRASSQARPGAASLGLGFPPLGSDTSSVRAWWARHCLYQPHMGLSYWWSRRAFRTRAPKSIRPGLILETPPLWASKSFLMCGSSKGNADLEVSVQVTWAASTPDLARGQPWVGGGDGRPC